MTRACAYTCTAVGAMLGLERQENRVVKWEAYYTVSSQADEVHVDYFYGYGDVSRFWITG